MLCTDIRGFIDMVGANSGSSQLNSSQVKSTYINMDTTHMAQIVVYG